MSVAASTYFLATKFHYSYCLLVGLFKQESCATTKRTVRCHCKLWYVSKFTVASHCFRCDDMAFVPKNRKFTAKSRC